jgi:hypothetical protein
VSRESQPVLIVSGLPRSGTSLLMQMLVAAGIEPLTDGIRQADENNPHGYFESQRVLELAQDATWLHSAGGKVVKIVIPLLPLLPDHLNCKILVMVRDLHEVVRSQNDMLVRLGLPPHPNPGSLVPVFQQQLAGVLASARRRAPGSLIEVQHAELIRQNRDEIARVLEFVGVSPEKVLEASRCVDQRLYRAQVEGRS